MATRRQLRINMLHDKYAIETNHRLKTVQVDLLSMKDNDTRYLGDAQEWAFQCHYTQNNGKILSSNVTRCVMISNLLKRDRKWSGRQPSLDSSSSVQRSLRSKPLLAFHSSATSQHPCNSTASERGVGLSPFCEAWTVFHNGEHYLDCHVGNDVDLEKEKRVADSQNRFKYDTSFEMNSSNAELIPTRLRVNL